MGLFGFGKKKDKRVESKFFNECLADYHKEAAKYGVATEGLKFVPELLICGEKSVLSLLQNRFYLGQYADNPTTYYFTIVMLAVESGVAYAAKWHEDFSGLNEYVELTRGAGPVEDAENLIEEYFPDSIGPSDIDFFQHIFERWAAMTKPHMKNKDAREYIYQSTLAAYQLGVSMMLEKVMG